MESATIITLLALSEPNIPEGPKYEKISTLYRYTGVFYGSLCKLHLYLLRGGCSYMANDYLWCVDDNQGLGWLIWRLSRRPISNIFKKMFCGF